MVARPGNKLISLDFSALEPKVLAYFSRDPNLLRLYGQGALANDVYLYNAAKSSLFSAQVRETGYDPDNPKPETIARAKHECATIRKISKKATLSFQYGASAGKIYSELRVDGIDCRYVQVEEFYRELSNLYSSVEAFRESLVRQWHHNRGWFLNGRMRPLAVADDKLKDVVNRFVQSTGHDLLMNYIYRLDKKMRGSELQAFPWLVNFHDETVWEVVEQDVAAAADVFRSALQELNDDLEWDVPMTGDVVVADNFAEIKIES